jgi:putative spermidine/putrescine transport system permease protein
MRTRGTSRSQTVLAAFNVLFVGFLMAPVAVVVLVAFTPEGWLKIPTTSFSLRWFRAIAEHPEFISAFRNSLGIAVVASILATVIGTSAALGLVRYRFPGRDLVSSALLSPLMVPTVVSGVALLYFFSRIGLASTLAGVIIAHVVVTGPYVIRTVSASLAGFDRSLELAAMTLGAGRVETFRRVTLPLILPGVTAGAVFAFIVSFDELTVTLFVTGPRLATLPIRIYNHITYITDPLVAALSALLVFVTIGAVLLLEMLVGLDRLLGAE